MNDRQATLRSMLGPVGVWSFALQTHPAAIEQAAATTYEDLGYRAAWFPESIGSKEAFSHAAILLAGSPRIVVATGIANIHARDAAAMVSGARTLAEAYPGRFVLGIGVSHAPSVAKRGGTYGRPIESMTAYLDAMDAADWVGPASAERPPLVLAALGPRMLDLAAERAEGAHPYFVPVEHTRIARERLGPEPVLAVEVTAVLETDRAAGLEVARAFARRYLDSANYANNLRRLGFTDEDIASASERLMDAIVVQGDAAAIAGRVREHLQAGADHVCVQLRAADPTDLSIQGFTEVRDALGAVMGRLTGT
ncbi:MAG: TIGR03620 family F420-dependent LLM class oxidoreductase [Chloroflexi bacterium]|jgi:probable F420-dependent oxidoreductase|nr:TIGR03620 family F420-dependent LLM class oxidoreductase [Chloroflexota bacterium]